MGLDSLKQDLLAILEEEIDAFRRMLDLLKQQQRALVRNDLEAIQSATASQQKVADEVGLIEMRRTHVVRSIGPRMGLDEKSVTITRLCEACRGEMGERLRGARDTLLDLQAEILQTNRSNALLIRHAVRYVDRTLQLLKGGDGPNRVYQRSGVAGGIAAGLRAAVNRVA